MRPAQEGEHGADAPVTVIPLRDPERPALFVLVLAAELIRRDRAQCRPVRSDDRGGAEGMSCF